MTIDDLNKLEDEIAPHRTMSGYARCPDCLTFGVPFPHDRVCGNCGKPNLVKLHDEKAVLAALTSRARPEEKPPVIATEDYLRSAQGRAYRAAGIKKEGFGQFEVDLWDWQANTLEPGRRYKITITEIGEEG